MKLETRQSRHFELRKAPTKDAEKPGLTGTALRYGQLDTYRTVFAPGCARGCIDDFVANGAFLASHDADDLAIGFVRSATDTPCGLEVELEYHSTPAAADARTVAMERIDAGRTVGLSIGFKIGSYVECENGQALLDTAASLGMDINVFDQAKIRAFTSYCYLLTQLSKIPEVSQVNFAAVPESCAAEVRSDDLGMAPAGQTLADQLKDAHGAVEAVIERASDVLDIRQSENKQLGKESVDGLRALHGSIGKLLERIDEPSAIERQQAKFARLAETLK